MKKELEPILAEIHSGLLKIYGVHLKGVYLYGSYARHEADDESDVDILVVLDEFEDYFEEVEKTSEFSAACSLKHGTSISKVFMRERDWLEAETSFLYSVRSEAVPV